MHAKSSGKQTIKDNPRLWLIFLILLPLVINSIRHPNNDFGTCTATVRAWVAGDTNLYDGSNSYYSYTPWSVLVYLPFAYLPHPLGQLIFNTLSLGLLIWATWRLSRPISWVALAISLTTLYTGMLVIQGQWDALVLASFTLSWLGIQQKRPWLVGIGLVGMTTKYSYIIFPLLLMSYAIRQWPFKELIRLAILPLLTIPLSIFIAGVDWPVRYSRLMKAQLAYYDHIEMNTVFSNTRYPASYWYVSPPFGSILICVLAVITVYVIWRVSRKGINLGSLNLATALNLLVFPYFTFHHLIYLAPIQAQLLKRHRIWGYALFGVAVLDMFLLWMGVGLIVFPVITLVALLATSNLAVYKESAYAQ